VGQKIDPRTNKKYRPVPSKKLRPKVAIVCIKCCDFNGDGKVSMAELSAWKKLNRLK